MNLENFRGLIINNINYENYLINNKGDIYSLNVNRIMKQNKSKNGYLRIGIWKDKKMNTFYVHRIVANTFIGDITGLEINHINLIKTDNRVENIEITNSSENTIHFLENIKDKKIKSGRFKKIFLNDKEKKEFENKYGLEYYRKNKEKQSKRQKEFYQKNKDKIRKQQKEYQDKLRGKS